MVPDADFGDERASKVRINLAGIPPTIELAVTSLVTTALAATIAFSPIVTPGMTDAPTPTRRFS